MSYLIQDLEYCQELSAQQEQVTGGNNALDELFQLDDVTFEEQIFAEEKTLVASGDGAAIQKQVASQYNFANAFEQLDAFFGDNG